MSNDPRKNINNLLFRPNVAIDDDQPGIYFYSQSESTTPASNSEGGNTPQNINPSGTSTYEQPNLFNPAIFSGDQNTPFLNDSPQTDFLAVNYQPSTPSSTYPSPGFQTSQGFPQQTPVDLSFNPTTPCFEPLELPSSYQSISRCVTPPNPIVNLPLSGNIDRRARSTTSIYRRVGSKRPVYAPTPGLESNKRFEPLHTNLSDYFSSPLSELQSTGGSDSSQENSPFLSPVYSISDISHSASSISSTMPTINDPGSQLPTTADVLFPTEVYSPLLRHPNRVYAPLNFHWFFKREVEEKIIWKPFSMSDSENLEKNFTSPDLTPETNIPTDGGRFDVNILKRQRTSVYWNSKPSEVRRCSWFHKNPLKDHYVPFEENIAIKLEEEYKIAADTNQWSRSISLPNAELVIFHSSTVFIMVADSSSNSMESTDGQVKQRLVRREVGDMVIDEGGETEMIDHLLFMVHGIGPACDLKLRAVEEVVEDFRTIALQLIGKHYSSSCEQRMVNRIEVLPISWYNKLHSEETEIDNKLRNITLDSIPKLRKFTNNTLLDILFYTSPFYGQTIISCVGEEINRLYDIFKQRNSKFTGGVSLAGHSLGSLILFDILCNQTPPDVSPDEFDLDGDEGLEGAKPHPLNRKMSRRISYMVGSGGTGKAQVNYPILNFQPACFFALGSPIGMFVTIRGLDGLGEKFALPTCPGFFNIFHPYDPVAYRIESLINPQLANVKPVLIPHHKGRKRMHLELKETMAKVGSDLKQRLVGSMKNTWNSIVGWSYVQPRNPIRPPIVEEVDRVLQHYASQHATARDTEDQRTDEATGLNLGALNGGRRVDYVLQEAPVEFVNEYIFALFSHVGYWDSEDTALMIVKEIYNLMNISPDSQIPQQTMSIERPGPPSPEEFPRLNFSPQRMWVDPTAPIHKESDIGPPPLSGFVKKSP